MTHATNQSHYDHSSCLLWCDCDDSFFSVGLYRCSVRAYKRAESHILNKSNFTKFSNTLVYYYSHLQHLVSIVNMVQNVILQCTEKNLSWEWHCVVSADKVKELTQDQDGKPLNHEILCNTESCSTDPGSAESGSLPAFFSLAALAEVAAMENMHRYEMSKSTLTVALSIVQAS